MARDRSAAIALPLPGARGSNTVTAYLLPGPRPALVDPGPCTPSAEAALRDGLRDAGVALEDVRLVFVTHSHANHCGGVAGVLRCTRATVVAHPACRAATVDWEATTFGRAELLRRAGLAGAVPSHLLGGAVERLLMDAESGADIDDGSFLRHTATGHVRAGAGKWNVLHTPGHTRDHICLYQATTDVLLSGDVLARDGAAVPWLEARRRDGARPGTLSAQLSSWRRLGRLTVRLAWPGHGPPIRAHRMLIARRLANARSLVARARSALVGGAESLHDVMLAINPEPSEATLAAELSRTVAALDWLVAKGEATRRTAGGFVLYGLPAPRRR